MIKVNGPKEWSIWSTQVRWVFFASIVTPRGYSILCLSCKFWYRNVKVALFSHPIRARRLSFSWVLVKDGLQSKKTTSALNIELRFIKSESYIWKSFMRSQNVVLSYIPASPWPGIQKTVSRYLLFYQRAKATLTQWSETCYKLCDQSSFV